MTLKRNGEKRNYDGRCSHLTEEDVARRKRAGHKYVVRFKVTSADLLPYGLTGGTDSGRPHRTGAYRLT